MEKISRAIILAAGYGSRLEPVSKNVPKPLIRVNGIVMIESIIESLLDAGIKDIIIVVGYLKEQFIYLNKKYNVKLIENKFYNKSNNISSLFSSKIHSLEKLHILCTKYPLFFTLLLLKISLLYII